MNESENFTDHEAKSSRASAVILICSILLFVTYVFSPIVFSFLLVTFPDQIQPLQPVMRTITLPLKYAYDHVEFVKEFYDFAFRQIGSL